MSYKFILLLSILSLSLAKPIITHPTSPHSFCIVDNILLIHKGVFEAWKEHGESVEKLLVCNSAVKAAHSEFENIINMIQGIVWWDFNNVINTFKLVAVSLESICDHLLLCEGSKAELWELLSRIVYLSPPEFIRRIYNNIMMNGGRITEAIEAAFEELTSGNYEACGYNLGDAIELLFFKIIPKEVRNPYVMHRAYKRQHPFN
eukprot:TRINITY_DN8663_c0_g2_i1.p1 TRINITY_DN8663_c0_g2~~TRINITY_DN8663_c0_g2_i1.p1  ORF type:complete len:204 (-),score=53.10 TRINITY_DN8663_c0_g2_i1:148-759(-)